MTLAELRDKVRFKTKISNTADLSNSDIDTLLNDAQDYWFSLMVKLNDDLFEEQKTKFDLVNNSSLYSQPTACVKIKQIRLAYSTPTSEDDYRIASFYDPASVDNISTQELNIATSNPIVDVTNNYFRIYPKPSGNVANGGEIYYIEKPSALVNSADIPVIPLQFHDLLATHAGLQIAQKFSMLDRWKMLGAELAKGEEKIVQELTPREINKAMRFRNILETTTNLKVRELY